MNEDNFKLFVSAYKIMLEDELKKNSQAYAYGIDQLDLVVERMTNAFKKGSFNKDGNAIKRTCKHLGIAHTYKAMNAFWGK
jgi:hypothetical protein